MKHLAGIIIMLCAIILGANATADSSAGNGHVSSISYGKAENLPDAAVALNPEHSYKLIFNISQGGKTPGELIPDLVRAARFLNLANLAGVAKEQVQLAVVIYGPATQSVLKQDVFHERFGGENQNLALLAELRKAGVEIFVCGQALSQLQLQQDWVSDDVEVAVAAMTVVAEYQLKGYYVMP